MCVTYLMQTDPLENESLFWDRYHTLSPDRQKKIDQFVFPKDKQLCLAAGLAFQAGLADYGLREQQLTVACHQHGKPYLPEYPELFFNIAHSEKLAICAFSNREIGADVEKITTAEFEIAQRFFDAAESRDIMAAANPRDTFGDYWTLKESYMKATGLGFKLPLKAFRIAFEDEIRVYLNNVQQPYRFCLTTLPKGYKLAVCAKGEPPQIQLRFL